MTRGNVFESSPDALRRQRATVALAFFIVLAVLISIQSIGALVDGYRFLRFVRRRLRVPPLDYHPRVTLVLPCKGLDADFEENVRAFLNQDYSGYQIVFSVASEKDPAHAVIRAILERERERLQARGARASIVVAGFSEERGEKVHNLLQALHAVEPDSEVLAFADADAHPRKDWLRALVSPLCDPRVTVSTGFRWYLPGESFASQLRAAWDTSIATMLGEHRQNFAWGGSMALRVADFRRLRIAEKYWARTVSDDYGVTRAVRDAEGHIRFEPRCLVASRGDPSLTAFFRWSTRQIVLTRVYAPHLWWMGLASYLLYGGTFLSGATLLLLPGVAGGVRLGVTFFLATILFLGVAKGRIRAVVARTLFPEERSTLKRFGARYWQLAPLVPWVMLGNFLVAGFVRQIEWRGTVYELRSSGEVRVLRRSES